MPADKNRGSDTGDISGADAALKRTRAEADYKMALQKCTEQSGPARESCEAEAKATLDATLAP